MASASAPSSAVALSHHPLRSWLASLQDDPARPDKCAGESIEKGWHAELRHENRISGKERFARVQLIRSAASYNPSYCCTDCAWWIRTGDVTSSAAASSRAPNETREYSGSRPKWKFEQAAMAMEKCERAVLELTGRTWAELQERDPRPADNRGATLVRIAGKFELASDFVIAKAAAARSTEEQHAKLAGRSAWRVLTSIAWQVVMQHCDTGDALCLAATCKSLAADACHALAWKHTAARRIKTSMMQRCEAEHLTRSLGNRLRGFFGTPVAAPIESRPSAFVPLHLDACLDAAPSKALVAADVIPPWTRNLVGLSIGCPGAPLNHALWTPLIQSPQVQTCLRSLEVHDTAPSGGRYDVERLLQLLPKLERLRVMQTKFCQMVNRDKSSPPVLCCPSLREVQFDGFSLPRTARILTACPALQVCTFDPCDKPRELIDQLVESMPAFFPRHLSGDAPPTAPTLRFLTRVSDVRQHIRGRERLELDRLPNLIESWYKLHAPAKVSPDPSSAFVQSPALGFRVEFAILEDACSVDAGSCSRFYQSFRRLQDAAQPRATTQIICFVLAEREVGSHYALTDNQRLSGDIESVRRVDEAAEAKSNKRGAASWNE